VHHRRAGLRGPPDPLRRNSGASLLRKKVWPDADDIEAAGSVRNKSSERSFRARACVRDAAGFLPAVANSFAIIFADGGSRATICAAASRGTVIRDRPAHPHPPPIGEPSSSATRNSPAIMTKPDLSPAIDVLVVGGGSAALAAAISARRNGASVRLIEQAPAALRGGNTRHARNFRLVHDGPTRFVRGTYDESDFFGDLVRVCRGPINAPLARRLIRGSAGLADWLVENGVRLQDPATSTMPDTRRTAFLLGGGKAMINALYATAARLGVTIDYDSELVGLEFWEDRTCRGAIARGGQVEHVAAKTAVICAGGHQANTGWLREDFGPAADGFMVRGTPYANGAALRLLLGAGAKAVGNPTHCHMVAVDARGPRFDGGIVTRITAIPHGIVVDRDCRRFADEGGNLAKTHFAEWGARIAERPGQIAYLILDANGLARTRPAALPPIEADDLAALAAKLQLDPVALEATVRDFNAASPAADGPSPKPRAALPLTVPPFSCYPMRPGITFMHYGVAVDTDLRVLRRDDNPLAPLFAAGMIMAANVLSEGYLAGLGVTISIVSGRLAGEAAARQAAG
jgi:tricarballylate dehydrogenase